MSASSTAGLDVIASRRSVRAFLDKPVARADIEAILSVAGRAPSGSNIQPWQVIVVTGDALKSLKRELVAMSLAGVPGQREFNYYPQDWRDPYLARRRKVGWALYTSVGIARGEKEKMAVQHARNFDFFGAPVGLMFTIDRDMQIGSWLDYGMFLQSIMIAARGFGLDTCPQAAFSDYHVVISERLSVPPERQLICGMALGFANPEAPENNFDTERADLSEYVRFVDATGI